MIYDVLEEIFDILKGSEKLNEFCKNEAGGALSVFLGSDENNLTDIDNAPFIVIDRAYSDMKKAGNQINCESHFYLFFCLYNDVVENGIYRGVRLVDEFAHISRWVILNNLKRPVEFIQEMVPSEKIEVPLRSHPVYTLIQTARVFYKETQ